jgi:hypothetical protein
MTRKLNIIERSMVEDSLRAAQKCGGCGGRGVYRPKTNRRCSCCEGGILLPDGSTYRNGAHQPAVTVEEGPEIECPHCRAARTVLREYCNVKDDFNSVTAEEILAWLTSQEEPLPV